MKGKIVFHFDDGFLSHYEIAFPIFRKYGVAGCISLPARETEMGFSRALEMQNAGWEIMSHAIKHVKMYVEIDKELAYSEIVESKKILEENGFLINQFVTPCSALHPNYLHYVKENYKAAFTVYKDSQKAKIDELVMKNPVDRYGLYRACLSQKSLEELFGYVDYVKENDAFLVLYDHNLGEGGNISAEKLDRLISYIKLSGVPIMTSSEALED